MRIYIPSTSVLLQSLLRTGSLANVPLTCFAVTPGLREHYLDDDLEELEYVASSQAARAALRLIASTPTAANRRIVVAADVPDSDVVVRDDLDIGVVQVQVAVPLAACVSVHCDDADAEPTVAVAAELIDAADLGDSAAEEKVDDAEGFELCWYATQEIEELLASIE
jgi:uncharacterized protein DUF6912